MVWEKDAKTGVVLWHSEWWAKHNSTLAKQDAEMVGLSEEKSLPEKNNEKSVPASSGEKSLPTLVKVVGRVFKWSDS